MDQAPTQRSLSDPAGQGTADHRRLTQRLSDVVDGRQILSPAKFIEMMGLDSFARLVLTDPQRAFDQDSFQELRSHFIRFAAGRCTVVTSTHMR
ncbi:hypothetical protein [Variovorax sp. AFSI2.2]|uniref:hypothetical protein n=1 Tax=Variovorax sp. AFSI2.2 TaxID=3384160 RepID=UPI003EBE9197